MNTCFSCKYWSRFHTCSHPMLFIENTYKNSEHSFEAKTVMNGISVKGVLHYKDTVPFVHMGPDFGCIHHEPKESSKADLIGPAKKRAARK